MTDLEGEMKRVGEFTPRRKDPCDYFGILASSERLCVFSRLPKTLDEAELKKPSPSLTGSRDTGTLCIILYLLR
jgi:hypothetical protein